MIGSIRTHGGRVARAALPVAALAAALALSACSSQTSPTPPASKPGTVPSAAVEGQTPTQSLSTPTPSSTHQGSVSPNDYAAIVASMKKQGFRFRDETGLLMQYGTDKQHVTVNGTMSQETSPAPQASAEPSGAKPSQTVSVVEVVNEKGTWLVVSAK